MNRMLLILAGILITQMGIAQKYSNEFLAIGAGAHAQALGNAVVATTGDATSGYWNPAGLLGVEQDMQIAFMHSNWLNIGANYDYAAIAKPFAEGRRAVGLSFVRFGIDNIPNTLSLYDADGTINYDNITRFSAADYGILLSYAQKVGQKGLRLGGNVKVIHRTIGPFAKAWGFGLDFGAQYAIKNWNFGAVARDVTGTFNAWSFSFSDEDRDVLAATGNEIPINSLEVTRPRVVLAAAWHKDFTLNKKKVEAGSKAQKLGIQAEVNMNVTTDSKRNVLIRSNPFSIDPYLGVSLDYNKIIFIRTGFNNLQQTEDFDGQKSWIVQPNFGVGIKLFKLLQVDYALANIGESNGLRYSHVFSFILDIDFEKFKQTGKK